MATIRKIRSGKWFVEIRKKGYPNISKALPEIIRNWLTLDPKVYASFMQLTTGWNEEFKNVHIQPDFNLKGLQQKLADNVQRLRELDMSGPLGTFPILIGTRQSKK